MFSKLHKNMKSSPGGREKNGKMLFPVPGSWSRKTENLRFSLFFVDARKTKQISDLQFFGIPGSWFPALEARLLTANVLLLTAD